MKNRTMLFCVSSAMALASLSASAGMKPLSDQQMQSVSGQAYVLTVGINSYTAPFAYEVFSSKAPAAVVTTGKNVVTTWAPGYPAKVGAVRSAGLAVVNTDLSAATTSLQAIPFVGSLVPSVSITTSP